MIEAVKMDANMTSEGHHFSLACQILLLWTQPGPGAVLTSSVDRSSSSVIVHEGFGVLLQLLQGFGGCAMARVGGVLQQLNGDVFVISSRIRNKARKDGRTGGNSRNSDQIQEIMWNQHQVRVSNSYKA